MATAHLRVDLKLTLVLGENYTSSVKALNELLALDYGRELNLADFGMVGK